MRDQEIGGTCVKTETIVDELGKIEIVLSDKTGTITQNIMKMDKVSIKDHIIPKGLFVQNVKDFFRQPQDCSVFRPEYEMCLAFAICNNVRLENIEGEKCFNASSPDEVAMVEFFEELGFDFLKRDDNEIFFYDPTQKLHRYRIVKIFPFESARKRMGIIVQDLDEPAEAGYDFYLKGADDVMREKVLSVDDKVFIEEKTLDLAKEGLRTLCFAHKRLSREQLAAFQRAFEENLMRGERLENVRLLAELEFDLRYLGLTGVKDLLQAHMQRSIEQIDQAKVNLWVLTGDKLETAAHICRSAGLVNRNRVLKTVSGKSDAELARLLRTTGYIGNSVLLTDGRTLAQGLALGRAFLEYCLRFKFVCFARCSPVQKFQVARALKLEFRKRILAVGDGGNDVGMIQEANVGVGIQGKEGNQAALASDFTIRRFCFLCKLIFFHGRNAHRGLSSIAQFVLHRGLIISWLQEIFTVMFYFLSIPVFNGFMMATYSAVFTILPVFSVILDVDIEWEKLNQYLNSFGASGKGMRTKHFLVWTLISIYQASAICITGFQVFDNFLNNFVGITFTALILNETFNIVILVPRFSYWMALSIGFTIFLYVLCTVLFQETMQVDLFDFHFFTRVSLVFLASWAPVFALTRLAAYFSNSVSDLV